ncbi:glycosyltransferase family 1 protein [Candidatus Gracilibacteria bacterium]|nr:glycosyltransferase family 1 protein [Candidatus Gracilibacteria bacterium]
MKIALLGTRGIPASYSGFETCVEQLGQRLVQRGHDVTVYCRSHHISYEGDTYKGMRLVKLPTIANKYLDTLVHSFISSLHTLPQRYDVGLYFIAGNSPVTWIPRIVGTKTIINVDGLDWKREKWPAFAKAYIQIAEWLATWLPNEYLTDSRVVQGYYRDRFKSEPPYIPYGSDVERLPPGETLARFGLEPGKYVLFVGRMVPENCAHHLVEAFQGLNTTMKCVIVGDAPYAEEYKARLQALAAADPRVILTGYVFGKGYQELGSNAHIFVETSGVGGTHPALIEAMAFGNCVITNATAENMETIGDAGFGYSGREGANSLRPILQQLLDNPTAITDYRRRAQQRASTVYTWEAVTDAYEQLFYRVCGQPLPKRLELVGVGAYRRLASTCHADGRGITCLLVAAFSAPLWRASLSRDRRTTKLDSALLRRHLGQTLAALGVTWGHTRGEIRRADAATAPCGMQ